MINVALHCNKKFGCHHRRSLQRTKMTDENKLEKKKFMKFKKNLPANGLIQMTMKNILLNFVAWLVDSTTKMCVKFFQLQKSNLCIPRLKLRDDESVTKTGFQFKISADATMNVPFSCGTTILFNACLLTHRQNIENVGKMPMINVALHCNEKFGRHHCCSLHRIKMTHGQKIEEKDVPEIFNKNHVS